MSIRLLAASAPPPAYAWCVWDYYDAWGVGGNSEFYVLGENEQLHELSGDLWRWLSDDPDQLAATALPGCPVTWIGELADFTTRDLSYDDGLHNYAWRNEL